MDLWLHCLAAIILFFGSVNAGVEVYERPLFLAVSCAAVGGILAAPCSSDWSGFGTLPLALVVRVVSLVRYLLIQKLLFDPMYYRLCIVVLASKIFPATAAVGAELTCVFQWGCIGAV